MLKQTESTVTLLPCVFGLPSMEKIPVPFRDVLQNKHELFAWTSVEREASSKQEEGRWRGTDSALRARTV